MKSVFLSFVKRLLIFSIVIALVVLACFYLLPSNFISPTLPFLLPFFFSITLIAHYLQIISSEKSFARFTTNYMLVTFLKLMLFLIVLLIYVFTNRYDAIPFIVWFFIFYILFSVFEVFELQNMKKTNNQ